MKTFAQKGSRPGSHRHALNFEVMIEIEGEVVMGEEQEKWSGTTEAGKTKG